MKLDSKNVTTLKLEPGRSEQFVWDDDMPGFGVRLRGDSARYVVQYRVHSQQRRESLGDVRKVKLKDAREIAQKRFAQVELGTDPAKLAKEARDAAAGDKKTLAKIVERYVAMKAPPVTRPNTYVQIKLHLERYWKPLHAKPIGSIELKDVSETMQEIVQEHGRTSASRARGNLSALFAWAMGEGLCKFNPVIASNDPAEGIKPRDRLLSDAELTAVWRACEEDDFGRIVRLLILTGCRREEIGGLKWSEIDLDSGIMTIPGERTKNHKTHVLKLPALALDILKSAPQRAGREFVFGIRGGSFSAWSYSTMALHGRITAATGKTFPHWTLHDLRRTMRTGLANIDVEPHIAELVINHVKGGVEAIYDRATYRKQITAALEKWADHVSCLITPPRQDNVTPFKRA